MRVLCLDLGTHTGYAISEQETGTAVFSPRRFEGGGMRFLRFRQWLSGMLENGRIEAVYFEEVRRHLGVDAAHVYGGFLAILSEECERRRTPYAGIPIQTIKKHATGKGNADKAAMIKAAATRWPGAVILDDNTADALCLLSLVLSGGA